MTQTWRDFVEGKRVAVVGPAPSVGDQSADVDAHDVVIRVGYRCDLQPPASGYGEKLDAVFWNYWNSRKLGLGLYDSFVYDIPWVLVKKEYRPPEGLQNFRVVPLPFKKANQIPIVVGDLLANNVRSVTVFGTDLYLGGPSFAYEPGYSGYIPERIWWEIKLHQPEQQHRFLRSAWERSGKIEGDERFLSAMRLSTREYIKQLTNKWEGK